MSNAQGLQYYDVTIPANKSINLSAPGKYFRFYTGQASGMDSTITLKSGTGAVMCLLKPGQSIKLNESVTDWYLGNYSNQATITGIVVIGDGEIVDTNVAGSVSVIDGGMARTMANQAFLAAISVAPTVGQYGCVQLWNPAGSTKNLIVEAVSFSASAATGIYICADTVQRSFTLAGQPVSKLIGGGVSLGIAKSESNAVGISGNLMMSYAIGTGVIQTVNFKEPIVIKPNYGLTLINASVTVSLFSNFEYFEQ